MQFVDSPVEKKSVFKKLFFERSDPKGAMRIEEKNCKITPFFTITVIARFFYIFQVLSTPPAQYVL